MIGSCVTVCLVPEAGAGPFVFHGDLEGACREAASLGFDAIEIFGPSGTHVEPDSLVEMLDRHRLDLAAVGTGAGMVLHGHSLSAADPGAREQALDFARGIIDFGAAFGAPAIIGSMQGRSGQGRERAEALEVLAESLRRLASHAAERDTSLFFEPLNRYETDLVRTLAEGIALLEQVGSERLLLLADLFHMNIEEADIAEAIRDSAGRIGHLHFVDSNRRAAGFGHIDYPPIARALASSGYSGYASAEAFPFPDSASAASQTIESFRRFLAA